MKPIIIIDQDAYLSPNTLTELETAGYIVIIKKPTRNVTVIYPPAHFTEKE